jgi:regulator of protease activity HflC (stomatin/prohibitin superfamily)
LIYFALGHSFLLKSIDPSQEVLTFKAAPTNQMTTKRKTAPKPAKATRNLDRIRIQVTEESRRLRAEWQGAERRASAAEAEFRRQAVAKVAAAPGSSYELVGKAACEALLCRSEADDARADFLKI